jgi:hypothetical protein
VLTSSRERHHRAPGNVARLAPAASCLAFGAVAVAGRGGMLPGRTGGGEVCPERVKKGSRGGDLSEASANMRCWF